MGVLQAALNTPGSGAHPCSGASCNEGTRREPTLCPYRRATLTAKHKNAIQAYICSSSLSSELKMGRPCSLMCSSGVLPVVLGGSP
ncbi:hypothetical protein AOLI_G00297300 [Acnodon oligacanthus]